MIAMDGKEGEGNGTERKGIEYTREEGQLALATQRCSSETDRSTHCPQDASHAPTHYRPRDLHVVQDIVSADPGSFRFLSLPCPAWRQNCTTSPALGQRRQRVDRHRNMHSDEFWQQ